MSQRPGFSLAAEKTTDAFAVDRKRMADLLARLPNGRYTVTVEKFIANRSNRQNAYYHGVVVAGLAEYWGLDHDDAHELIKLHCNKKVIEVVNKETGEVEEQTIGASTAGLNKEEWALFIERCQRWAATEFNFVVPDPDPEYHLHRYEAAEKSTLARTA